MKKKLCIVLPVAVVVLSAAMLIRASYGVKNKM